MPFLDWSSHEEVRFELSDPESGSGRGTLATLELVLLGDQRAVLREALAEVFSTSGAELRLGLPSGWTLFWKLREGDSRLLLAHPEHDRWVGSVGLNAEHARILLLWLAGTEAASGSESFVFRLGELANEGAWSGLSNLEVVLVEG
jgi:hypothetical protein